MHRVNEIQLHKNSHWFWINIISPFLAMHWGKMSRLNLYPSSGVEYLQEKKGKKILEKGEEQVDMRLLPRKCQCLKYLMPLG